MDSSAGQKAPHILILDDDTAHQELCLRAFRDDPERYRVTTAGSLREARAVLERDLPDLIIADWILPEGKGIEILTRTDGNVTIPLIIMTSYGDEHLAVEIMKSGAIDYVVKSATAFRDLPHIARRALRDWENIRNRKLAESAVRDSEKRLADVINFLPDATFAIDREGRVIAWNKTIENMTGVSSADMLGKGNHEYSIPFYGERRPILINLVLMDDAEIEKKYDYIQRDDGRLTTEVFIPTIFGGKGAYLWGTAAPLYDAEGNRTGAIEVIRDITERKRTESALQKSEGRFRHISGLTSDFAYSCTRPADKTFSIDWITGAFQKITGYPEEEILKMGCWRGIVAEEDLPVFNEKIAGLPQGSSSQCELRIRTKDGAIRWLRCFTECNQDAEDQTTLRLFGGCKDITSQKNADEALLESERNLLRAQEIGHIGNWNGDIAGNRLVWSDEIYRIFGVSSDFTLTYDAIAALIHPDDRERVDLMVKDFLADGNTVESGFRITRPDGKERWLYQKMEMAKDPSGSPKRAFGIIQDITDRKVVEQALVESEKKYRFLIDNVRDVVWQTLPDLTFTYVSPSVESRTGYSPAELTGTSLLQLLTESSARNVRERLKERMEVYSRGSRDLATVFEIELTRKDGGTCWFEVSSNAVFGPDQSIAGFQGISRDITERKKVERALMESEERFRDLFNNMGAGVAIYEVADNGEDFIIRDVNRAVETIEHISKEEILGKSVLEVFPGVKDFGLFDVFQRVARTGIAESHPVSMYKDDRIAGWRENFIYKLPSGEIVAIYEDVTEKKRAEEESQIAREWLGIALRAAKAGTWDWDVPTGRLEWSMEFFELFGLPPDAPATYATWLAVLHPDDREPARMKIDQSVKDHTSLWNEYRIILPGGGIRWIGAAGSTKYTESGVPVRMSGVCIDITERKLAEEIREAYEARLDSAMEIGSLAWWEMDLPDGAVRFDDRKATMLGYSPEMFRHYTDFTALLHPDDYEPAMQAMRDHLEGKEARYHIDYRIRTAGGDYCWFRDVGGITRRHPDGLPATVTGIILDITERKIAERAIAEDAIRRKLLVDQSRDGIVTLDSDGKVFEANQRFADLLGYSAEEIKNLHVWDWDVTIEPDQLQQMIRSVDASGDHFETRHRRKDGRVLDVEISTNAIVSDNEKLIFCVVRDISEKKATLRTLMESETRFRALIQNSSDIIRILDANGQVMYESPSAGRILGYPPGYLVGRTAMELVHPDDLGRVKADFREVVERKNTGTPTEFRIRMADGEYLWVDAIGTNLLDVPGVNGIVVTTRPVQQRKEAEQALLESEERLRLAMEGADVASWDWDLRTGAAVFSDRFYTMLEYQPGEFPATYEGWIAHIHPDDKDRILPDLQKQIAEKRPLCEIEYRLLTKDGNWLWILGRGKISEFDEQGTPSRLTGVNIDITSRRLMESEIRSLNTVLEERVKDRTEALQNTNEALEEENAQRLEAERKLQASYDEKVMLLKEIHHRVKNNLQIIASLLNLQSRYIKDEATLAAIRESQNRVKAMALVHEKLYKAEDISHISLNDYIRFLGTGLFQFYDARSRGIQFHLDIEDVKVDINSAIPLGLIINELISNSLKYAFPEGRNGEIAITVKKDGHTLTVLFRDTGIGIPADLDWQNTPSLGLRLVNTLVDQMDGTIELDRSTGTQFTMVMHEKE